MIVVVLLYKYMDACNVILTLIWITWQIMKVKEIVDDIFQESSKDSLIIVF